MHILPAPDAMFRLCSALVMPGWLLLLFVPGWRWSQRMATGVLPLLLAAAYALMLFSGKPPAGAGFSTLPAVMLLFTSPAAVTAGWIHYLCFDLFTGAWQVRDAQRLGISHLLVVPCLLLTFLLGPLGLLCYLLLRLTLRRKFGANETV